MDIANSPIDWTLLSRAIGFYKDLDFKYRELSWFASPEAIKITLPVYCRTYDVADHGSLIGSAEQAFLELDTSERLGKGKFIACTPCFRDEKRDLLHQTTFMKVELYQNIDVTEGNLSWMMDIVSTFLRLCLLPYPNAVLRTEQTSVGWDLTINGVEVGSYGMRQHGALKWLYGTGIAEPRFSLAAKTVDDPALN